MSTKKQVDDLIVRLNAGNESIAWDLDRQFRQRLCDLVDRKMNEIFKRRQDPEDIVQSVMRTFYVRAANGEFHFEDKESLWKLLSRIARNKMLKRIQKDKAAKRDISREKFVEENEIEQNNPSRAQVHVLAEALDLALSGLSDLTPEIFRLQLYGYSVAEVVEIILRDLPPPYPRILQLRLEGHREQEIAEELGCFRGKVRYKVKRMQERLAALLGDDQVISPNDAKFN